MVDVEIFKARETRCRLLSRTAQNSDLKWLYSDMARHYRKLIEHGAYDANVRVNPFTRDD